MRKVSFVFVITALFLSGCSEVKKLEKKDCNVNECACEEKCACSAACVCACNA